VSSGINFGAFYQADVPDHAPSAALLFKQIEQLQRFVIVPGFEKLAYLVDVTMNQEKVVAQLQS